MITKLLVTLFVFSISVNALSVPIAADCVTHSGVSSEVAGNSNTCGDTEASVTKNQQDYVDSEARAYINMRKRPHSVLESLMAMFFIPGLILLWFSRFTKSSK